MNENFEVANYTFFKLNSDGGNNLAFRVYDNSPKVDTAKKAHNQTIDYFEIRFVKPDGRTSWEFESPINMSSEIGPKVLKEINSRY